MKVPLLDLGPPLAEQRREIVEAALRVIDSTRYIQGPEVEGFEQEIADYCNADHAVGVSSGTDALLVSLMALGIGPGDLVLTTPYSFFATLGVILRLGALPVFADIDPETYNIDPDHVETIVAGDRERKIKAIIPVHLFGQCADMESMAAVSRRHGVPIVEDAAQAIGAELPVAAGEGPSWRRAGSFGTAGCFSFFPSKNLGALGDGGMVVSSVAGFAERVRLLRNHGGAPKYHHQVVGGNFRLDALQAAVLRVKLKRLDGWHRQRRENAERYAMLFGEATRRGELPVSLPVVRHTAADAEERERNVHIYNQYVIRAERRDELRAWLSDRDIGTEIYYPLCLHEQKCLSEKHVQPSLPQAERAARETLALPIYPGLTRAMQEYVVESIAAFYR